MKKYSIQLISSKFILVVSVMHRFSIVYFVLLTMIFFGCTSDDEMPEIVNEQENPFAIKTVTPSGNENYLNEKSDYVFDQNELRTYHLVLPEEHLNRLDADPAAEEYVEGMLVFEGDTISPVGIRYKGSIGAFGGCLDGADWLNPSGKKICPKLSMKVKLNWNDPDDKFFELKKLQFHAMNKDLTQMRERLGYWLFRQMGVPAPRAVHAQVMINGNLSGLYTLVEQIDGRFTRENYEDGTGNLYKEVWPLDAEGNVPSADVFIQALKTNEDENPSVQRMLDFGTDIADAAETDLAATISRWMNIEEIMSFIVVDRVIKVDDGPFHWYCPPGVACFNHNYYWYENPSDEKMHLIPWDLDNAFEGFLGEINPVLPIADEWNATSNDCEPFPFGELEYYQASAACNRIIHSWSYYESDYDRIKTDFLAGPFSETVINKQMDNWQAQISNATMEASAQYDQAVTTQEWQNALNALKNGLAIARQN